MKATSHLSHGEFFKLCELVRKNKDQLSMNGAVAMLPTIQDGLFGNSGRALSISSLRKACAVVGVTLSKNPTQRKVGNSTRILALHLKLLYQKLGEPVPDVIEKIHRGERLE